MDYLLATVGLALLLWGADRLLAGALAVAARLGMGAMAAGVLVVGLGTSLPELVTSLDAALRGAPAAAVGNVVGSNIANILLVLGVCALCAPLAAEPRALSRDLAAVLLATGVTLLLMHAGDLGRLAGLALTAGLVAYLALMLRRPTPGVVAHTEAPRAATTVAGDALTTLAGIVALAVGAHLLVSGALGIARSHGVSESVIGLTLLALATSLPELVTGVMALLRRQGEVAIGNVVGSTLFNLLGILGITALVNPLAVPDDILRFDAWVMLAAVLALAVFARTGWRLSRTEGAVLVLGYPAWLAVHAGVGA